MLNILKFVKSIQKKYFYLALICYVIVSLLPYVQIHLMQMLLDMDWIEEYYLPFIIIAGLILQKVLLDLTNGIIKYVSFKIKFVANYSLNDLFYNKCECLPFSVFENPQIVKDISIVRNGFEDMCIFCIEGFFGITSIVITMVLLLGIISRAGCAVLLISLVTVFPVCTLSVLYSMKEMQGWSESGELWEKAIYYSGIITGREYAKESHIFQTNGFIHKKWERNFDEYNSRILKMTSGVRLTKAFFVLLQCLSIGAVIGFLLSPLKNHTITIGLLVATVEGFYQITNNIGWNMAIALNKCAYSNNVYSSYKNVVNLEEKPNDNEYIDWNVAYEDIKRNPVLEVKNLWFRYEPEGEYILKGVDFTIDLGKQVLLLGENGSGKTTLIKLILGLYTPEKGSIKIGGYNISGMPSDIRSKIFSVVFQDYAKYEMSLKDNLEICNHRIYENSTILNWLKIVDGTGIFDSVKGFDKLLGKKYEDGMDVSNGQWQKIALIRAISKEYSFLIMDEPTAAQDPMAEVNIYRKLIELLKNKSGLLITHRLGAAKYCDSILVMKDGKISESGTHKQLMREHKDYFEMYKAQKEWYDEDIA